MIENTHTIETHKRDTQNMIACLHVLFELGRRLVRLHSFVIVCRNSAIEYYTVY